MSTLTLSDDVIRRYTVINKAGQVREANHIWDVPKFSCLFVLRHKHQYHVLQYWHTDTMPHFTVVRNKMVGYGVTTFKVHYSFPTRIAAVACAVMMMLDPKPLPNLFDPAL